jgi:hypothetical protein
MNRLLSTALVASMACAATVVAAAPPAAPDDPSKDSALVQASKDNGGARKKKPRKVITNADVKKSKGKLIVLPPRPGEPAATERQPPSKGLLEQQEENRKARLEAEKRLSEADGRVKSLEKELARIEQSYYDEADPNRRDSAIGPRFIQTKRQLDDARKQLADARDAYDRAGGVKP